MSLINIAKKIYRKLDKPSPFYNKGMNSNVDVLSDLVEIGDNFISAPGSIILAHDASTIIHSGKARVERTKIGNKVFLGANAVILPGVTVGDNVIIGAGAIVTKDIPDGVVVGGNPARVLNTVENYLNKCKERDVLFDITDAVLKKHGTGVKATPEETAELVKSIYKQIAEKETNE